LIFAEGVTAIVAPNATGKSNLLDAAYLGCTGALPAGTITASLRRGENEGFVGVELEHAEGVSTIHIGLAPGRKLLRLDGQAARTADIARVAAAVLITPADTELIHGSPARRRAYLDALLSKLSPRYGLVFREYNRVVEQRNAALKSFSAAALLEVWTEQFLKLGSEIHQLRRRVIRRVQELAAEAYRSVANDDKLLGVKLHSHEEATLSEALENSRQEERNRGATLVGPHREDVLLDLDGNSVQVYGSRGEARTAALALRIAEYRLLENKHHEPPVLLLDDFTAELDASRRDFLLRLTQEAPQALVSGTEAPPKATTRLRIIDGVVSRES